MEPRQLARSLALGRIAVGAALLTVPGLARLWIGEAVGSTPAKLLTRALGARDVALGVGLVRALERGAPARGWVEGGMLADGADLLGTLLAGSALPMGGRLAAALAAGSGVAAGVYLVPRAGALAASTVG